jgi:hypothetical protein
MTLYVSSLLGTICFAVIIFPSFDTKNQLPTHPDSFFWKIHSGFLLYSMRSFSGIIITMLCFISSIFIAFSHWLYIHMKIHINRMSVNNESVVFFIKIGITLKSFSFS